MADQPQLRRDELLEEGNCLQFMHILPTNGGSRAVSHKQAIRPVLPCPCTLTPRPRCPTPAPGPTHLPLAHARIAAGTSGPRRSRTGAAPWPAVHSSTRSGISTWRQPPLRRPAPGQVRCLGLCWGDGGVRGHKATAGEDKALNVGRGGGWGGRVVRAWHVHTQLCMHVGC